jgi:GNAT superfamily N-acetyltransferase
MIRNATPDDVPLVLRFIRDLARYERLEDRVTATESHIAAALFGARPYAEALIAEDADGAPAGFALFFHNFSTFTGTPGLYLEDLFVEPDKRGRGYGKALLARLAAIAKQRGCARFEWAVLDWNAPSIAFYQSLGAKPLDDWTVYRVDGDALEALAAQDRR